MSVVVEWFLLVVSVLLALPVALLALQAIVAFRPMRAAPPLAPVRPRLVVLIPAHDESSGLVPTMHSVMPQLGAGDRCVVVADNCSDDTAAIAAREGATVFERSDVERRGKGYALDFGLRRLDDDPPEVVVVVDADCVVAPGCLDRIGRLCAATGRPVQALYLMTSPADAKQIKRIAEFAWRVKNWGRPLGFMRLGLPCQLMGSGMALPWRSVRTIDLATGHLVEDVKMGIDLARQGTPPLFCPHALVTSVFPTNDSGERSQRTRWEHGHLAVIVREVPSLAFDAIRRRSVAELAMVLDLAVPPLALLVLLVGVTSLLATITAMLGGPFLPFVAIVTTGVVLATSVMLFWVRFGSDVVSMKTLGLAISYAVLKIPMYFKFMVSRQVDWVRSKRDGD